MASFYFYDIESLNNVFTLCNFRERDNTVEVFVLSDDKKLTQSTDYKNEMTARIMLRNKNFNGKVEIYDLSTESANRLIAQTFGLSDARIVNNPNEKSSYHHTFRLICDTDKNYDKENDPFLMGYNSYNYDTTILAKYLYTAFTNDGTNRFTGVTAKEMREFNNILFLPQFKKSMPQALTCTQINSIWSDRNYQDSRWRIRKNMLLSGRHLDVAKLNEKQSRVSLKRLLGMLGYQILESDKLGTGVDTINSPDELYELVAYNVSDCINLAKLFHHKFYQAQFTLKQGLLDTYPELIYEQREDAYAPNIGPTHVRRDRLCIDSTSAQFATKCLCPYGHLADIETVSFVYPSDRKVEELRKAGQKVKQVNVLEEAKKFFEANFHQPELRAQFDKVYKFYKTIEGKNFNASSNYLKDYMDSKTGELPSHLKPHQLAVLNSKIPMFYYDGDGNETSCFVTFSTGGIHGAEYNKVLFEADMADWQNQMNDLNEVKRKFPDPLNLRTAKTVTMDDGRELPYKEFLISKATIKAMTAVNPANRAAMFYKPLADKKPQLFKEDSNGMKLNPAYTYTSCDPANHEDFTSYYPNLLRMMSAFWNEGLGIDRYGEIFENKEKYGKLMKDKSLTADERALYSVLRDGTKLILNSASGAGDTKTSDDNDYSSPIQMNNRIISMRIIGQLFTWRIGQAQAAKGAKITSTNTDGLYSVLEEKLNNAILEKEAESIGVAIEPEPVYLVSKDSNNRFEMHPITGNIISASGGSLACREDTDPTKSLSHPAIIDWALTEYMVVAALNHKGLSMSEPFNDDIGRAILSAAKDNFEMHHLLRMYQNVIASSPGSVTYVFATEHNKPGEPIILQHYNRTFLVKDNTPKSVHIHSAAARVITPATKNKRLKNHERPIQHDRLAMSVLRANNATGDIKPGTEAIIKKVTGVEADWFIRVENRDLTLIDSAEQQNLFDSLDQEKYLSMLRDTFENNWRNKIPVNNQTNSTDKSTESIDKIPDSVIQYNKIPKDIELKFINEKGDIVVDMTIKEHLVESTKYHFLAMGLKVLSPDPNESKED